MFTSGADPSLAGNVQLVDLQLLTVSLFRYGCDIGYNDVSNRNSHEKKKHGGLFNGAERGPNAKHCLTDNLM